MLEYEQVFYEYNFIFHVIQVFFPVCADNHYYLVVYWMKKNIIDIIDNIKPLKDTDPLKNYDIDIGLLVCFYLCYRHILYIVLKCFIHVV